MADWFEMWRAVASARFTSDWTDKDAATAAYERHNAEVRASVPAARLVDWQAADGWKPLCDALGVDVPDEPFPHLNTREDFPTVDADTSLAEALEQFQSLADTVQARRQVAASGGSRQDWQLPRPSCTAAHTVA